MKLLGAVAVVLALVPGAPVVGFEAEGVRVGDQLVSDTVMQLKDSGMGHVLVSQSAIEPLVSVLTVYVAADRTLELQPGLRVSRVKEGFSITAHNRRRIEVELAGEKSMLMTPAAIEVTAKGWKLAGREVEGNALIARRVVQDDVDSNLDALNKSSKKIQGSLKNGKPGQESANRGEPSQGRPRYRRPFGSIQQDIFVRSEGFSTTALLLLRQVSPNGF